MEKHAEALIGGSAGWLELADHEEVRVEVAGKTPIILHGPGKLLFSWHNGLTAAPLISEA